MSAFEGFGTLPPQSFQGFFRALNKGKGQLFIMNLKDFLSGLFWLGISIFVCLESSYVSVGSFKSPGPGFLPFWAGIILGTFSIIMTILSFREMKEKVMLRDMWREVAWQKVVLILLAFFLYIIFMKKIGYSISTFGLMLFMFITIKQFRLRMVFLFSFLIVSISYLIFSIWLGIPLPKGIFGF